MATALSSCSLSWNSIPLHDRAQPGLAQIEADPVRRPHPAAAQVTDRDGDAEEDAGIPADKFVRSLRFDHRSNINRHGSILLAPIARTGGGPWRMRGIAPTTGYRRLTRALILRVAAVLGRL